jgi:hypothetical protein
MTVRLERVNLFLTLPPPFYPYTHVISFLFLPPAWLPVFSCCRFCLLAMAFICRRFIHHHHLPLHPHQSSFIHQSINHQSNFNQSIMLAPNPLTVACLSLWTFSRWTTIAHHTCHGGYNAVDDTRFFNSKVQDTTTFFLLFQGTTACCYILFALVHSYSTCGVAYCFSSQLGS